MSAVGLQLVIILCLSCTALSGPESGGVLRRDLGGTITIQCRSDQRHEYLNLKRGLSQDDVLVQEINSVPEIADIFKGRLQLNGEFPNIDILIKNLTADDTGPYWCSYSGFDSKSSQIVNKDGKGSVLLVVTEPVNQCDPPNQTLVPETIMFSAAAVLSIILIWIIIKGSCLSRP